MSQFLHNLIDRHQAGDNTFEPSQVVQPRPRARFENTDMTESFNAHDETMTQSTMTTACPSTANNVQPTPRQQTDTADTTPAASNRHTNDSTSQKSILAAQLAHKALTQASPATPTNEQPSQATLTITDEVTPRVQEVLQQRHQPSTPRREPAPDIGPQPDTAPRAMEGETENILSLESTPLPQTNVEPASSTTNSRPLNNNHSSQKAITETGVLQPPDWLAEVQSTLNDRGQTMNTETTSEPVVNVTIGRIEIKAEHTDTPTKTNTRQSPRGIMSLNEYLQQRNEGRS